MRTLPHLALAVAMSTLLAGCSAPGAGGGLATADELKPEASREADAWDDAAELIAIISVEGDFAGEGEMDGGSGDWMDEAAIREMMARALSDEDVGDGRCEFWAYAYRAPGKQEMLIVIVNRTGGDPWAIEAPFDEEEDDAPSAIGSYKLDSDEALSKAKEGSDDLRDALARENVGVMVILGREESFPNPAWVIMAGSGDDEGGDMGFVIVDAVTGEILAQFGFGDMMGSMGGG